LHWGDGDYTLLTLARIGASTSGVFMATGFAQPSRLASLDQFRGYTVAGMFLVNFIGSYDYVHDLLRHHNTYCSYADTIMPQFFFAVGMSFRLTYLRRVEKEGNSAAMRHAFTRNIGLMLVGLALYGIARDLPATWEEVRALGVSGYVTQKLSWSFIQTLVHIAIASLFVLPVIGAKPATRIVFMTGTCAVHILLSYFWYFQWNETTSGTVDGGPLGFMTWSVPLLVGSLAYDVMAARGSRGSIKPFAVWSVVLMIVGYALSSLNIVHNRLLGNTDSRWLIEPPFMPPSLPVDMWTMNQHAGSASYQIFAAGFSLLVLLFFIWFSDLRGIQFSMFRTLGVNALAGYIIHDITGSAIKPLVPEDAPAYMAVINFLIFFWLTWLFLRHLEKHKLFLRL
jgi:predicted acyltransferase